MRQIVKNDFRGIRCPSAQYFQVFPPWQQFAAPQMCRVATRANYIGRWLPALLCHIYATLLGHTDVAVVSVVQRALGGAGKLPGREEEGRRTQHRRPHRTERRLIPTVSARNEHKTKHAVFLVV